MILDHIGLSVRDFGRSATFFRRALAPLGIHTVLEGEGWAMLGKEGRPQFWIGVHGIPMAVPHTRETDLTPHGNRTDLLGESVSWISRVDVPGSASSLLEFRLAESGQDAIGFTAHVPHYLSQAEYPPAAIALLGGVTAATGLAFRLGDLEEAAAKARKQIDEQVAASDEIAEAVRGLEARYDGQLRGSPGVIVAAVDSKGDGTQLFKSPAVDGKPLQLTLEPRLQLLAEPGAAAVTRACEGAVANGVSVSEAVSKGLQPMRWWGESKAFLSEVQAEFRKIAWPTQSEIMGGTISVVVVVTIIAVALGIVDWVLSLIMSQVIPA